MWTAGNKWLYFAPRLNILQKQQNETRWKKTKNKTKKNKQKNNTQKQNLKQTYYNFQ